MGWDGWDTSSVLIRRTEHVTLMNIFYLSLFYYESVSHRDAVIIDSVLIHYDVQIASSHPRPHGQSGQSGETLRGPEQ